MSSLTSTVSSQIGRRDEQLEQRHPVIRGLDDLHLVGFIGERPPDDGDDVADVAHCRGASLAGAGVVPVVACSPGAAGAAAGSGVR